MNTQKHIKQNRHKTQNFLSSKKFIILGFIFITFCQLTILTKEPALASQILTNETQGQTLPVTAKAIMGNKTIDLEVAITPSQQALGLMYRTKLPENRGMLFTFAPPKPTRFWMKNTKIALDMIFLNNGEIKAIEANVPPCQTDSCPSYGPKNILIDQVIELSSGSASKLGLKLGDRITVEFLPNS